MRANGAFVTNTSWALVGNTVYLALQWAVLILLTKRFPQHDVGLFALALAITGPTFVLSNLRLRNMLATDTRTADLTGFFSARLITTCAAMIVCVTAALSLSSARPALLGVMLVTTAKGFDAMSDICHGLFQRQQNLRTGAIGLVINGIVSVALVGFASSMHPSFELSLAAYAAGSAAALFLWDLPHAFGAGLFRMTGVLSTERAAEAVRLLRQAAPLGASTALGSIQANVPRYAIAVTLGPESLAVFAALAYIPVTGALVINAVGQAALPALATEFAHLPEMYAWRLRRLLTFGVALGIAGVMVTLLLGRQAIALIYTDAYAKHVSLLLLLMCAAGISYTFIFLATAATAQRRFALQLRISSLSFVVMGVTVMPLVESFGLHGATYAMLLAATTEAVSYAMVSKGEGAVVRDQQKLVMS